MSKKRKTAGERVAGQLAGWCSSYSLSTLAAMIDRAIRRAQAKAWDDGYGAGAVDARLYDPEGADNPYRGRRRK